MIPLEVHAPRDGAELPAILYFHGGGLVLGSNHSCRPTALQLAHHSGAVVVAVDYRLAPEHKVPTQVEECFAATVWVCAHGAELGIDPAQVAVVGDNAGATLAAGVALMARDLDGPDLLCQALVYPGLDDSIPASSSVTECGDEPGLTFDDMHYLRGLTGGDIDRSPYAVPSEATDLTGLPQTVIAVADLDPTRHWVGRYATRLAAARVQTTLSCYPGTLREFVSQTTVPVQPRLAMAEIGALLAAKFANPSPW